MCDDNFCVLASSEHEGGGKKMKKFEARQNPYGCRKTFLKFHKT